MKKVCMIVPNRMVKGGIASVVNGYRGSKLEKDYDITYVESYTDGSKLTKLFKGISGYIQFIKVLLTNKPDIVHIHSSFGPSFYRKMPFIYMASWAKIPIVNHIHGADFDEFYVNASESKKKKIKKIYEKCSVLIALSEEWKERLILFLGELGKRKGCYDIPEVIRKVKEDVPDVKFVLAGAGSEADEKAIKKLIDRENVSDNVEFPGWVRGDTKDKLLREADVFFLPSYNEGMPMSVLDAMGYGFPVVSTNVGGIPKIVHDGENGYCCDPGDVNRFAKRITKILLDGKERKSFGEASWKIVKEGYSLEAHLNRIEQAYKQVLLMDV